METPPTNVCCSHACHASGTILTLFLFFFCFSFVFISNGGKYLLHFVALDGLRMCFFFHFDLDLQLYIFSCALVVFPPWM